jgi:tetratricopeptide (TPR) repeat protein
MSFRFWRRISLMKGVTLNLSKRGVSVSVGPRGAKYTIGTSGQRATVGLPGTGLFYTVRPKGPGRTSPASRGRSASVPSRDRLTPNFFERLTIPRNEQRFIEGLRELTAGHRHKAIEILRECQHIPDAVYIAGFQAISEKRYAEAEKALLRALAAPLQLGRHIEKYGVELTIQLSITDSVAASMGIERKGALLGLVEIWQANKDYQRAADALMELRREMPGDVVVKLSLAELLLTTEPDSKEFARMVADMTVGIENECHIHAALLLYRAKALRVLGLPTPARDALTAGLRRTNDRPAELLRALRYERGLVYEDMGQAARARSEFERLYAEDPGYEDVSSRLGR